MLIQPIYPGQKLIVEYNGLQVKVNKQLDFLNSNHVHVECGKCFIRKTFKTRRVPSLSP